MLNKCQIIGNLGADPEMRYTQNGQAVTNFNVATSRKWTQDGEQREETEWFSVVAWGKLAEVCAQYLAKGRQVYVEGRMQTRSWEGDDGVKRYRTELVAQEVKFLGGPRDSNESGPARTAPAAAVGGGDIDPNDLPF